MNSDPYSTSANLSSPVIRNVVDDRNLSWLTTWLSNGKPHKRLASEAFGLSVSSGWMEGMEAVWSCGWCSKKPLLNDAFIRYIDRRLNSLPENDPVWLWLIQKTYTEKTLSKAELNGMHIDLLYQSMSNSSELFWNFFFKPSIDFKGAKAGDLLRTAIIYSGYNKDFEKTNFNTAWYGINNNFTRFMQKSVSQLLDAGITVPIDIIIDAMLQKNTELFWKIMKSPVKMSKPDMIILLTYICIYFRKFRIYILDEPAELVDAELELVLQCMISWGLPEKVTFSVKDLEDKSTYFYKFDGLLDLHHTGFSYNGNYSASHLPAVEHGLYNEKVVPVDFYVGDIFLAKPKNTSIRSYPEHGDKTNYVSLSEEEKECYRQDIKRFFL